MTRMLGLYASEGPNLVHYSLNPDDATITRKQSVSTPEEIQYAWVHPTNQYIYVASSTGTNGTQHYLSAFRISAGGALHPIGMPLRLKRRPIHVSVDAHGKYLLTAYNVPSSVTVHAIGPDGAIGSEIPQPSNLSTGNYAHQIREMPSKKSAILVARGTHKPGVPQTAGSLEIYSFDNGKFQNAQTIAPDLEYGPRHLDFHPTKPWLYVSLEHQNEIQMYQVRDDQLTREPLFTQSLLADAEHRRPRQMAGTIHVHPNGRNVYVANRGDHTVIHEGKKIFGGGENSIAVFAIDEVTGEPKRIQLADPLGYYIRCFDIDPDGGILATASLNDMNVMEGSVVRHVPRRITLFRISANGMLTVANSFDVESGDHRQWWMKIVELPNGASLEAA